MKQLPILNIEQFPTPSPSSDFYANDFATHLETNHKEITIPHKHNFFLAVLFTVGSGTHEVDFQSYPIKPGSVFLLNPGQTHHWELSDDIDGYIFFHTQSFYDLMYAGRHVTNFPFYYSLQNSPCLYLEGEEREMVTNYFKSILQEHDTEQVFKQQKLCSLIDLLYIELSRIYVGADLPQIIESNNYAVKLQQLEQLIDEHFVKEKSPAVYADMLNVSPKHLTRITQTMVGKTTSDLIAERVLLEAKRMLIRGEDSYAEIGYALGYDDYSYFSRLFKKRCGETPRDFQRRYLMGE